MPRHWRIAVAALAVWASPASALDVTGNWSISGANLSTITTVSLVQNGNALSVCLNGWGTIATGTVDDTTGAFTLTFDVRFASVLYEFGVCALVWNGTVSPDGNSITGAEMYSLGCAIPGVQCCLPPDSDPITGSRISPTVVCCGNGILEESEQCDVVPVTSEDCCANNCTFENAGHFCGATDACHLKECNALGVCEPLPPADCGACYECDPVAGCLADIRTDCKVGGNGARVRVTRRAGSTSFDWQWREGTRPETTLADFGNPTTSTGYELCVFTRDLVPSGFPRVAAELARGQACGQTPCWHAQSSGFRYRDSTGSAGGILRTLLRATSDRRSTLKVVGRGVTLFPPLADEVIVQMSTSDASPSRCWSTTFTTPKANDASRYVATLP